MSTPTGDNCSLHDLERTVRAELALAEQSEPERELVETPIEDWLFDPADVEREEVALPSLLGAVKTVEGDARPGRQARSAASRPHGNQVAARDHCLNLVRAVDRPIGEARYGRMFPDLVPLGVDPQLLIRAGEAGGTCDAAAVLDTADADADDAAEAAGWPFFGQLVAHDITADRSPITGGVAPGSLHNARAPQLNLEMIYSDGPTGAPYMFDIDDPAKFLLAPGGADVPRNQQGAALIGDPRNDSHRFVLALHVALLHAHNGIVERLRSAVVAEPDVFDTARITLTWHYQWIVIHDFLPRLVGADLVHEVLHLGGRWFAPPPLQAFIPLEFADAAFRYGHGQIRHSYRLVDGGAPVRLFPDLVGFSPLTADRQPDLAQIFDVPGRPPAQRAKRLDGRLVSSLIGCPSSSPARSIPPPTSPSRCAIYSAARPPRYPAGRRSPVSSGCNR